MDISKLEEILNPYENSINDLEIKFSELCESCFKDTYSDTDEFDYKREFLKTKAEVISEFILLGLSNEDAVEAEQTLQMSKDCQYDESLNDLIKLETDLTNIFDNMLIDLTMDDSEKIKPDED